VLKAISVLLIFSAYPAFADVVDIVGPPGSPNPGDTFSVDVNVTGVTDLYAFQFDLTYNPALISALSVSEGPFLPTGGTTFFVPGTIDNVGGSVTDTADSLIGPIPGVTGDGVLATFQFVTLAPGTSDLSFANPIFLDSSFNDITANITFQNGSVTLGAELPEPSVFVPVGATLLLLMVYRLKNHALGSERS
jgi:hypothetical protein